MGQARGDSPPEPSDTNARGVEKTKTPILGKTVLKKKKK